MAWADPEEVDKIRQLLAKRFTEESVGPNDTEKLEDSILAFVEELFEQATSECQDSMIAYVDAELVG